MDLSDHQLYQQFRNQSLLPNQFDHEAHLKIAWYYIHHLGIDSALIELPKDLKYYVAAHGASDKYHETLTIAAIKTVYHFYLKSYATQAQEFIEQYPRLVREFKSLLFAHYSEAQIEQPRAKKQFVQPDLLPYDC